MENVFLVGHDEEVIVQLMFPVSCEDLDIGKKGDHEGM